MKNLSNSLILGKFSFLILSLSLLIGFYFNEISSGTGARGDFYSTWKYVLALKDNLLVDPTQWTVHVPLHYILLSKLHFLLNDRYLVRLFFCTISILVPFLFYLNLKVKFDTINKNILLLLASLIFLFPSFRHSAIWANNHITALIFFLLFTLFFLKWNKQKNHEKINLNIVLQIIFLTLAVYTRQYYVLIFLYLMIIYLQKLKFTTFIKISIIVLIFALPGFWLIYNYPELLKTTYTIKYHNSFLITSSIISFYLIPIFFALMVNDRQLFTDKKKILFIAMIFSILIVGTLLVIPFDYNPKIGGGFLLKLSIILFNNNLLFYLSSVIGFILLIYLSMEDKNNFILFLLFLFGFSGYWVFQKYFEPMFLFIFFLLLNSKIPAEFLKNYKNLLYLYIYVFIYFLSAIFNDIFQIKEKYDLLHISL